MLIKSVNKEFNNGVNKSVNMSVNKSINMSINKTILKSKVIILNEYNLNTFQTWKFFD